MNVSKLTETERKFYLSARDQGFRVIRGGYPDFALSNSEIGPFFVEVKNTSYLSDNQCAMMQFLASAGLPSYVSFGEFPKLKSPYYPVKVREPRCELCGMNTTFERVHHDADKIYRNKWNAKVHQLERKLEGMETRYWSLRNASKRILGQLKRFDLEVQMHTAATMTQSLKIGLQQREAGW